MSIPQEARKFACKHQPLVMESRDGQLRVVLHCPYCEIERLTREMIDERALHESEEQAFLSERDQLRRERDEYARCLDGGVDCAQEKLRLTREAEKVRSNELIDRQSMLQLSLERDRLRHELAEEKSVNAELIQARKMDGSEHWARISGDWSRRCGEMQAERDRLQRLLDMRPPYYCQNCECASCGNTFAVLDKG